MPHFEVQAEKTVRLRYIASFRFRKIFLFEMHFSTPASVPGWMLLNVPWLTHAPAAEAWNIWIRTVGPGCPLSTDVKKLFLQCAWIHPPGKPSHTRSPAHIILNFISSFMSGTPELASKYRVLTVKNKLRCYIFWNNWSWDPQICIKPFRFWKTDDANLSLCYIWFFVVSCMGGSSIRPSVLIVANIAVSSMKNRQCGQKTSMTAWLNTRGRAGYDEFLSQFSSYSARTPDKNVWVGEMLHDLCRKRCLHIF